MTSLDFDYIRRYVHDQSAIVLEPGKEYLVESRLRTLARKENFTSIDDLIGKMRSPINKDLHRKVVEALTTNETSFFRDLHPFEALRKVILPELLSRQQPDRKLNLWCGATSTGQEPYSVLMLIAQHFPHLLNGNLKFWATDLCGEVLAHARLGQYTQLEVNRGLPASLLVKFFSRKGTAWEIREDLKRHIDFREMNLIKEWVLLPPLDIIFLRNVMIYFDLESKKNILRNVRRLLRPGGYLLLGSAETTLNVDDAFERIVIEKSTFYRVKDR
jgi:chemotaxis protein methyltransferase CheR